MIEGLAADLGSVAVIVDVNKSFAFQSLAGCGKISANRNLYDFQQVRSLLCVDFGIALPDTLKLYHKKSVLKYIARILTIFAHNLLFFS